MQRLTRGAKIKEEEVLFTFPTVSAPFSWALPVHPTRNPEQERMVLQRKKLLKHPKQHTLVSVMLAFVEQKELRGFNCVYRGERKTVDHAVWK